MGDYLLDVARWLYALDRSFQVAVAHAAFARLAVATFHRSNAFARRVA